jgi:hypothetical protein
MSQTPNAASSSPTFHLACRVLVRLIVPAWVLAGAVFKLYERTPAYLPSGIIAIAKKVRVENLDLVLRTLIGCELFAVGVMLLVPRLARLMAIFILSCFCLILLGEIYRGATSCGCFGSLPFKPWQVLIIDGGLLLAVLITSWLGRRSAATPAAVQKRGRTGVIAAAAVIMTVGMAIAFAVPEPPTTEQKVAIGPQNGAPPTTAPGTQPHLPNATSPNGAQPAAPENLPPTVNPQPKPLPRSWYTENLDQWPGKPWRELDIFQLMPTWPKDMDQGKRYIIFYRRTCDHCQAMMENDLDLVMDGAITLVEVPESPTVMTLEGAPPIPFNVEHLEHLQLPPGPNWIIQTPLVIAVERGVIACAQEGDHKKCMGLE